jgi:FKBP-type peptidyl-prolyl cis-trans isomerase (trigger factor)
MKITINKLPKSEVEVLITAPAETVESYRGKAIKHIQETVEVDGFRKGNVPEDVIVKTYGDMIILEEMANLCLQDAYIKAINDHKLSPIAEPKVTITKLAKDNPLEIKLTVPVLPELTLPNYKKVAEGASKDMVVEEVTDKDIEDVLKELAKGRAHEQFHKHNPESDGHDHKEEDMPFPEIDDAFAQSFGDTFKTIDDLKAKVRENLGLEKKQKNTEKKRTAIVEALIKETKVDVPDALVESELERMLMQMKGDITRYGGTWEAYLAYAKKTEEELKASWRDDALKRSISQLVLAEIALLEKIAPTEEEIEMELLRLLAQVQDADENRARAYLNQVLTNEKVLKFLGGE